jgi:hypothetical protein
MTKNGISLDPRQKTLPYLLISVISISFDTWEIEEPGDFSADQCEDC